jgi:hypothetical protein
MSLFWVLIIMCAAGAIGGSINYLMSADETPTIKPGEKPPITKQRPLGRSVIIGLGAALLVPFFLEVAQSKLLDNVRVSWEVILPVKTEEPKQEVKADTTAKLGTTVTKTTTKAPATKANTDNDERPPVKDYLLFAAYCFLAAVAGPRFINNQVDSFLKDKQIKQLAKENVEVANKNEKLSDEMRLETATNQLLAKQDEETALQQTAPAVAGLIAPQIKPVTVANDPQKNRFGGKSEVNDRKLCATVESAGVPRIYTVKIWVESTDPATKPLKNEVVFYLHNTFRPSVLTVTPDLFHDDKAMIDPKLAWGAFTAGAVTDNGMTLLEYDLALDEAFPEDFRSR